MYNKSMAAAEAVAYYCSYSCRFGVELDHNLLLNILYAKSLES